MDTTKRTKGFRVKASVVPAVLRQVILFGFFGFVISSIHNLRNFGFTVSIPILGSLIPTLIIGFLVVFRTSTAYERFKEGRKNWGKVTNTSQNLARHIWVAIQGVEPKKRAEKFEIMRLLVAFVVAAKLYLREEQNNSDLARWLPAEDYAELQKVPNPPQQIAFWIEEYLQEEYRRKSLTSYQLSTMHRVLDKMVDSLGSCDRIIKTPMPLVYGIRLQQLLLLYCMSLPFQVVEYFRWYTWLVVALITFVVLGLEEINSQIENPFGDDDNDLDLDASCETVIQNIESLISHEASVGNWQLTTVNGTQDPQYWER